MIDSKGADEYRWSKFSGNRTRFAITGQTGRSTCMTRAQLSDNGWELVEPYLPIGQYGPYPERLRQQFEGVIRRFRVGGQCREMPREFGAWSTVSNRFRQWRDAGVFEALLEGLVAEAAKRGEVDLSLVSVDSTTARAHHDAAGMHLGQDVLAALEEAAAEGVQVEGATVRTPFRPTRRGWVRGRLGRIGACAQAVDALGLVAAIPGVVGLPADPEAPAGHGAVPGDLFRRAYNGQAPLGLTVQRRGEGRRLRRVDLRGDGRPRCQR
ncbi:hypothetical protein MBT84_45180 [Streptomyces sp. MBT84]|nr:hypothetical protein [Streptomyces sp. MBT84]